MPPNNNNNKIQWWIQSIKQAQTHLNAQPNKYLNIQ
jgi:hypothetical protein